MSDTPRTDEEVDIARKYPGTAHGLWVSAEFARELERELGAANRSADACLHEIDRLRQNFNGLQPEARPSEEVYRKAERYHWLRGATSEWSALFSEPPKWDGGALVRLGSRWTGAKLDEVIDAQIGNEPQ